jgi:hypothetical protein
MTEFASMQRGVSILDAYQLVSHVGDVRLGAMWPFWCGKWRIPVPICLHLGRDYADHTT